jgi:hypothetical protein
MTEIRSIAGANTYLARETTAGTAETTGWFGLSAMRLRPGFDGEAEVVRGGSGKVVTSVMLTDIKGAWNVEQFGADFNHLGLVAASVFGLPTTTTPGGGTDSRQHVFAIDPDGEDSKRSYTAIFGDGYRGVRGVYGYFNSLGMDIQRGELSFDTSFRSRKPEFGYVAPTSEIQTITITGAPDGGTFTLTYAGQTTANIAYNASASAVQSALVALSNIGAEDVVCAGGPLPGTAVTVTFQGALAQTDVALMTADDAGLTGGTSPEVAVAQTLAGAEPTDLAQAPMPSNMWDVWIDDSWANLGTTQYGGAYVANVSFGDKFDEDAPLNSSIVSYEGIVEKVEQDNTFELTLRFGATAENLADAFDIGTLQFFRLGLEGAIIEGSIPYACTIDFAAIITSLGEIGTAPNSAVQVLPMTLALAKDPTSGNYCELTLVNTVTAY